MLLTCNNASRCATANNDNIDFRRRCLIAGRLEASHVICVYDISDVCSQESNKLQLSFSKPTCWSVAKVRGSRDFS